jgi:hypothetical protein
LKLPHINLVRVEQAKLVDYLLNRAHPDNGGKAQFFASLGFSREEWQHLAAALVRVAAENEITCSTESIHGKKYIIHGEIAGPRLKANVRTIWIVDRLEERPRLVTAYPSRGTYRDS